MAHQTTINVPAECTAEQFEELLKTNGMSYEDTKYKTERIEKDLENIKGKTVLIFSDKEHVVEAYQYNKQLARENE
tara:strand:+ start:47 stop:274 length:228 start_codon:yes stop_codon:yes gene_type:complete